MLRDYFQFDCGCARCAGSLADDARCGEALAHAGCGGSWNAAGACAICGAARDSETTVGLVAGGDELKTVRCYRVVRSDRTRPLPSPCPELEGDEPFFCGATPDES